MAGTGTAHLRADALLRAEDIVVEYPAGRDRVHAVSGVSLDLMGGETLGLVGESGCGKSTLGRAVVQLPPPTSGSVRLGSLELTRQRPRELRALRPRMQMIFQDPASSLNPLRKVTDIVMEGLDIWGRGTPGQRAERATEMLRAVGIDPDVAGERRPHEFSGGQCQRICIARALVMEPEILVCDEPVSALDVSVQAQILNLVEEMRRRFHLTMLFISHDLAVIRNVSHRVMVMYLGKVCEVAGTEELFARPRHPYTEMLLGSIPGRQGPGDGQRADATLAELPSPLRPPPGCRFHTRCPRADARCRVEEPVITEISSGHFVACHHPAPVSPAPESKEPSQP